MEAVRNSNTATDSKKVKIIPNKKASLKGMLFLLITDLVWHVCSVAEVKTIPYNESVVYER